MPVGGRPVLAWVLGELIRFGVEEMVVMTGRLSAQVADAVRAVAAGLPRRLEVVFSEGPGAGIGGALHRARDRLDERFMLCDGGVLFDANLARLLADASRDGPGVVGRVVLGRCEDGYSVYLFDRRVLEGVSAECSLERDVLPRLAARGLLRGTETAGLSVDAAGDSARAAELTVRLRRPALFLDRDGVLNVDHGWVGTRERWEWTATAREAVAAATDRGWHVFVVTNQSGIARGHYDEAALRALHDWVEDELHAAGGTVDDWRFAPHHPEATVAAYRHPAHPWRKPAPGMILDLIERWGVDPGRCVLIGDQATDLAAAEAAGVRGVRFEGGDLRAVVERELSAGGRGGE